MTRPNERCDPHSDAWYNWGMTVSLPENLQSMVDERIRSGRYANAEAVIAAALVTLDQQEHLAELPIEQLEGALPGLREKVAEGMAALRAGHFSDGDEFFAELERED